MTRFTAWTVTTVAAAVLAWALPGAISFLAEAPNGFWSLALAALIVDIPLFGITGSEDFRIRSTLSVCFTFAIFMLWGAAPAIVVQALAGTVTAIGQRYHPRPGLYMVSRLVCAAAAAALVAGLTQTHPVTMQGSALTGGKLLTFALLDAVWFAVSAGLYLAIRAAVAPRGLREAAADSRIDLIATAASVLVVAPFVTTIPDWWSLLIAAPLMVWNQIARQQRRHERWLVREPGTELLSHKGLVSTVRSITLGDFAAVGGRRPFGIIMVNFESLLDISERLGRDLHEKVVAAASRRLIDAYGEDRASRLAGEGIAIVIPDLTEAEALAEAERAVAILSSIVNVDDIPFALNPAGGVALSPTHGRDLGILLMKADLAAGVARRSRKRAALYVQEAADVTERRLALLRELHAVLRDPARHHEIAVLYQPQVKIATREVTGVEALVRWTHPQWGPVPTDELIEAIEPTEVMRLLTRHVLESVVSQVRRWNEQGQTFRASVNVSVQDLYDPDFPQELGNMVREHAIAARLLVVEITERTLISDSERVSQVARTLADQGVGLSLDDFGTGYASLQQLRELPLIEVKVDQSYVRGIVDNPADAAILNSIYQLAQTLHIDVVAEGVEDQHIADALAKLPGTTAQGWHFGRPMTVDRLEEWCKSLRANQ